MLKYCVLKAWTFVKEGADYNIFLICLMKENQKTFEGFFLVNVPFKDLYTSGFNLRTYLKNHIYHGSVEEQLFNNYYSQRKVLKYV